MIDYDKLKQAHDLASERYQQSKWCRISIDYVGTRNIIEYRLMTSINGDEDWCFTNLDNLIAKLQQLTQPKAKYKVGDKVWLISYCGSVICEWEIEDIDIWSEEKYLFGDSWYTESELYPTKSALIEAQIEYWVNELKKLPVFSQLTGQYILQTKECQHERNGYVNKCKTCGEYYG